MNLPINTYFSGLGGFSNGFAVNVAGDVSHFYMCRTVALVDRHTLKRTWTSTPLCHFRLQVVRHLQQDRPFDPHLNGVRLDEILLL